MAKAYCTGYFTGKVLWLSISVQNFSTSNDLQYTVNVILQLLTLLQCLTSIGVETKIAVNHFPIKIYNKDQMILQMVFFIHLYYIASTS